MSAGPAYGFAMAIGCLAVWLTLPWDAIMGTGGLFRFPAGDLAVNLSGHLAFQRPGWHWPILLAPDLAWPTGQSIAMTDSNPALSIVAKLLAMFTGGPVNLMGVWLAACIGLQPVASVYAMRGLRIGARPALPGNDVAATACVSVLALLLPAFLFRTFAINLFGQFLLVAALGYAARSCALGRPLRFGPLAGFLILLILVHPYLFVFATLMLAAPSLQFLLQRDGRARGGFKIWALAAQAAIAVFMVLNLTLGGGGPGFGLYSTNVLAPVWPQMSGLFGPALPLLDATGYQREGFNYLGAGNLLLIATGLSVLTLGGGAQRRSILRRFAGLFLALGLLTALAVTPHITLGHLDLLPIDIGLLDHLLSAIRSSGRAVWLPDYAIILGSTAFLASRLAPAMFLPLMACVLTLQWLDTQPLRHQAAAYFAGSESVAAPLNVPAGTTLFGVVPPCEDDVYYADGMRLAALRAGARLANVRLAHPPAPAVCAALLSAALHDPLAAGETRLFLPASLGDVRKDALGTGAICNPSQYGLLCLRPLGQTAGQTARPAE